MELIDDNLKAEVNREEVENLVRVAALCINASPSLRPTMSEVVGMLEGEISVPDVIPEPVNYTQDIRFKAMRDFRKHSRNGNYTQSQSQTRNSLWSSSAYSQELFEIVPESSVPYGCESSDINQVRKEIP